jgi:hypothetical protein
VGENITLKCALGIAWTAERFQERLGDYHRPSNGFKSVAVGQRGLNEGSLLIVWSI